MKIFSTVTKPKTEQYFHKDIVWKCDQSNLAIIASHNHSNHEDKC